MAGVFGYSGKCSFNGTRIDFQSLNLVCEEEFIDTTGLRGTRSRVGERVRAGVRRIHGPLRLQPSTLEWTYFLQAIMGGTPTGSGTVTYPLADTLPTQSVIVDDNMKVMTYTGCAVDKATISAKQEQQIVELQLDLVGQDESVANAGTFPAGSIDTTTYPLRFYDCAGAITINSVVYNAKELTLTIDNAIDKDRFFNSQTLVTVQPTDRHIAFSALLPYGDASAPYNTIGVAGCAVTIVFTYGSAVLTFSFNNVKFPRKSPHWAGREESFLTLEGQVYRTGTTLEMSTSLNPGP